MCVFVGVSVFKRVKDPYSDADFFLIVIFKLRTVRIEKKAYLNLIWGCHVSLDM